MRTGEVVISAGRYSADCLCNSIARFAKGDEAPSCPTCGSEVTWTLRFDEDRVPDAVEGACEQAPEARA